MIRTRLGLLAAALSLAQAAAASDPHSYGRPDEIAVDHLRLDLTVDFEQQYLTGSAWLTLRHHGAADSLWLDTMDLTIASIQVDGKEVHWRTTPRSEVLGSGLVLPVTPSAREVRIDYRSAKDARALLWLAPAQTSGQRNPFVFSQNQSIHARSWIPIQDSPGVRFSYEATLRVPVGLLALMSAVNPTQVAADGIYHFEMRQPIPAYLVALAVGELVFEPFDARSGVYAEPELLAAAAHEFAQTPQMMTAVESLYGAYAWGRYDLLVLPPYFPFGGMENPCLSFITPTLLAGDRSLVTLIAHELAHSWSGNLVTNRTWEDFWLNEGMTVYLERRAMERIEGPVYAGMLEKLGYGDLQAQVEELGAESPDTALKLTLRDRDPEEAMTDIAYEKGYFFLRRIEELVGRQRFDAFLKHYFAQYAFGSIDTESWLTLLRRELVSEAELAALDVSAWVYASGMPPQLPMPRDDAFEPVRAALAALAAGKPAAKLNTEGWTSHHWVEFLRGLPERMPERRLAELDASFQFTQTGNAEVLQVWLLHSIRNWYEPALPRLEEFLTGMGRRKFLRPLYTELARSDAGRELAERIYEVARPRYHPLATRSLDVLLGQGR